LVGESILKFLKTFKAMSDFVADVLIYFWGAMLVTYMIGVYCIMLKGSKRIAERRAAKKARKKEKKHLKKLALANANPQPQS
jgi:hypothetical protein